MFGSRKSVPSRCARLALPALLLAAPIWSARADVGPTAKPATTSPSTRPTAAAPATKPAVAGATTKPAANAKPLTLAALAKPLSAKPESIADLTAIEGRVEQVAARVLPAVVGVTVGNGQGSGVIISPDGYVLTAAHVSGPAHVSISLTLTDGRRVRAETLGHDEGMDAGLIKIDAKEGQNWPYCEIGKSGPLSAGQWVAALGHPGGYRKDRPPVLRLGKVLANRGPTEFLVTDCTLVGGDSGGPLFDLDGKVIGIHSRIGPSTQNNMHVPADVFTKSWDRLAKGDEWGANPLSAFLGGRPGPMLGILGETVGGNPADKAAGRGVRVKELIEKSPAADVGIKPGDVIVQFDKKPIRTMDELSGLIAKKKFGDRVSVVLMRDGARIEMTVPLVRRPRD